MAASENLTEEQVKNFCSYQNVSSEEQKVCISQPRLIQIKYDTNSSTINHGFSSTLLFNSEGDQCSPSLFQNRALEVWEMVCIAWNQFAS